MQEFSIKTLIRKI